MKFDIAKFETYLGNRYKTQLIAICDGLVIGTAHVQYKGVSVPYISSLYVDSRCRRRGVATELLKECCAICAASGAVSASLLIDSDNKEVEPIYTKFGFRPVFEYDDKSVLMSKDL